MVFNKSEIYLFGMTFSVVVLLGLIVFKDLTTLDTKSLQLLKGSGTLQRSISSISIAETESSNAKVKTISDSDPMQSLDLECLKLKDMLTVKSSSSFVQIKGRLCLGEKLVEVTVLNKSNGEKSNIFTTNNEGFQTDFMALTKGKNHFLVVAQSEKKVSYVSHLVLEKND